MISRLHTIFKYDNKDSIDVLAHDILTNMPEVDRKLILGNRLVESGLILPPCGDFGRTLVTLLPWPIRGFAIKVIIKELEITYQLDLFLQKCISHIQYGVDRSDPKSAGGWNQDEFNAFLTILADVGYSYEGDPWWFVSELQRTIEHNKSNKDTQCSLIR